MSHVIVETGGYRMAFVVYAEQDVGIAALAGASDFSEQ
jgi:hypothetical protein